MCRLVHSLPRTPARPARFRLSLHGISAPASTPPQLTNDMEPASRRHEEEGVSFSKNSRNSSGVLVYCSNMFMSGLEFVQNASIAVPSYNILIHSANSRTSARVLCGG